MDATCSIQQSRVHLQGALAFLSGFCQPLASYPCLLLLQEILLPLLSEVENLDYFEKITKGGS